jgi:hypothetical protein
VLWKTRPAMHGGALLLEGPVPDAVAGPPSRGIVMACGSGKRPRPRNGVSRDRISRAVAQLVERTQEPKCRVSKTGPSAPQR